MSNYWVGVICGLACSLFIVTLLGICHTRRMGQYEEALKVLNIEQQKLEKMYAEHDEIMKAYEFYNWQYSKIIEKELKQ